MSNFSERISILLIEDNPGDVRIIREIIRELPRMDLSHVNCIEDAILHLNLATTDIILLDLGLPDSQGLDTVKKMVSLITSVPIVVLTGMNDDTLALASIKIGAQDFLVKGMIDAELLKRTINYAIERKQLEVELHDSKAKIRSLTENSNDRIWSVDREFHLINGNPVFHEHTLRYIGRMIQPGEDIMTLDIAPTIREEWTGYYNRVLKGERFSVEKETHYFGLLRYIDYSFNPITHKDGIVTGIVVSGRDVTARRKTEETLLKLYKAIDSSGEVVFLTDESGLITYINPAFTSLYGYLPEEVKGQVTPRILKGGTIEPRFYEDFWNSLITGKVVKGEFINKTRDGRLINIEGSAAPILNDEQKIIGYLGIQRDISDRKTAEEKLRINEKRYRTFIDSTSDYVFLKDENFRHLVANKSYCKSYNKQENEILGKTDFDLMPERFAAACQISDKKAIEQNRVVVSEELWDERVFESLKFPVEYQKGKTGVGGFVRDITNRKLAEEALMESEERYRLVLENSLDAILLTSPDGTIFTANHAACDMFQRTEEDLCSVGRDAILDMKDPRLTGLLEERSLKGKARGELNMIRKDGTSFPAELSSSMYTNRTGEIRSSMIIRDITERRQIQKEIQALYSELEDRVKDRTAQLNASNKELEAFSYSVSHDLRAPLRAIDGFTRILFEENESKFDDEGKRLCSVIRENTQRMGTLIDDLLSFSRLMRVDMNISRMDMHRLVSSVYSEIVPADRKEKISFKLDELCSALGDKTLLRQVWFNLISNAIKFSSTKENPIIWVSSKTEYNRITYCITDNGAGFDMKYKDKLFGVFQRLHSLRDFEGTGVGLAIVQRIINRHGGEVWGTGEVDKGASFYFSLPI
jgi:PAS domain S-box-containing protein